MHTLTKLIKVERTDSLPREFIALRKILKRTAPLILLLAGATAGLMGCADKIEYTYICYKTDEPIEIDGRLNETSWGKAKNIDKLMIYDGSRAAQYQTCAKILWDEKRLYVAFICQDSDICATMGQRDQSLYKEDVVELFIDADGDGKTYFEIEVNPLGTLLDVRFIDVNVPDNGRNWNGDIKQAVWVNGTVENQNDRDTSWTVEIAISFASVVTAPHIPPEDGDVWPVNLYRIERGRSWTEYSAWAPVGRLDFHQPVKFGRLMFSEKKINWGNSIKKE